MGKKRLAALLCAVVMALTLLPVQAWATEETEGTRYRAWYDAVTGETHREALPEGTMLQPFPADEQSDIALFAEDEEPDIDSYFLEINEYLPVTVTAHCKVWGMIRCFRFMPSCFGSLPII